MMLLFCTEYCQFMFLLFTVDLEYTKEKGVASVGTAIFAHVALVCLVVSHVLGVQ